MYATKDNEERKQHDNQVKDIAATQKRHKKDHFNDMFNLDQPEPETASAQSERRKVRGSENHHRFQHGKEF